LTAPLRVFQRVGEVMLRSIRLAGLLVCGASAAAAAKAPDITSISPIIAAKTQDIVIRGKGFGRVAHYKGDSDFIEFNVCRGKDCALSFRYGYTPDGNQTGIVVKSWTNTEIDIGGFTQYFGKRYPGSIPLKDGDRIKVELWEPGTGATKHSSECEITVNRGASTCAKR
jgi:hypothetical protein